MCSANSHKKFLRHLITAQIVLEGTAKQTCWLAKNKTKQKQQQKPDMIAKILIFQIYKFSYKLVFYHIEPFTP